MFKKKRAEENVDVEDNVMVPLVAEGESIKMPPKKKNVKKIVLVAIVIVIAALLVGNAILGAIRGPAPTYVQTADVVRGEVKQSLNTSGTLLSGERVTIFSPVSAPVTDIAVQAGGTVSAGQKIFTYDTVELERAYRSASAQSALGASQARQAQNTSNEAEQDAKDWADSVNNTRNNRDIEKSKLTSLQSQLADKTKAFNEATTEEEKSQIKDDMDKLQAEIEASTQRLAELEAQVQQYDANKTAAEKGVLDEEAQKQSGLSQVPAQVAFETARDNLNAGKEGVTAPISGVVTALSVEKGGVAAQYTAMCTIESLEKVDVTVALSRYDLERVQVGQKATVTTMGKTYEASVTKIAGMATTATTQTGTSSYVAATISLVKPDSNIKLGLEATVDIATGEVQNALNVPVSAVNTDVNGSYCYIVENGVAVRRDVTVGISSDTVVEIESGLQEGDVVILSSQNIMEGMKVSTDAANMPAQNMMEQAMMG